MDRNDALRMLSDAMASLDGTLAEVRSSGCMTVRDTGTMDALRDALAIARADLFGAETSYDSGRVE